jgi:hypothetical protein
MQVTAVAFTIGAIFGAALTVAVFEYTHSRITIYGRDA